MVRSISRPVSAGEALAITGKSFRSDELCSVPNLGGFHRVVDDRRARRTESEAVLLGREEWLEHALALRWRQPRAAVGDKNFDVVIADSLCPDDDRTLRRYRFIRRVHADGWNIWLALSISPAAPQPAIASHRAR
jgi:hypothetical protein